MVVINFLPHTHLDLGWLKTEQRYYVDAVKNILDSTVEYLTSHPQDKISYSDIGYVYMWIKENPENMAKLRKVVDSGQFHITNGGYVLNDFACPVLDDMIANFQYGRKFIQKIGHKLPRSLWSIDQFGISLAVSKIGRDLGYHQHVVNRLSDPLKDYMRKGANDLFNWKLSNENQDFIKTFLLSDHYGTSRHLDIDNEFSAVKIDKDMLNKDSYTLPNHILAYLDDVLPHLTYIKSRNILEPFGNDFTNQKCEISMEFLHAAKIFIRSNKLTNRLQFGNVEIHADIVTLEEYFNKLKIESNVNKPSMLEYQGDFFPLAECSYTAINRVLWTGYFTSSPYLKKSLRSFGELYRGLRNVLTAKMLLNKSALKTLGSVIPSTEESEWIIAGNQHHDTITGTSLNNVTEHYIHRQETNLQKSRLDWLPFIQYLLEVRNPTPFSKSDDKWFAYPPTTNITDDVYFKQEITSQFLSREEQVFRELGWSFQFESPRNEALHFTKNTTCLIVSQQKSGKSIFRFTAKAGIISLKVTTHGKLDSEEILLNGVPISKGDITHEFETLLSWIPFEAKLLKVSLLYHLPSDNLKRPQQILIPGKVESFKNNNLTLLYSNVNDSLKVTDSDTGFRVAISLHKYLFDIQNENKPHSPGKYIFSTGERNTPLRLTPSEVTFSHSNVDESIAVSMRYVNDYKKLLYTVHFRFMPQAKQTEKYSVKISMPPMDRRDYSDLCIQYQTPVESNGTFYTDSNGLFSMKRVLHQNGQSPEANYYPSARFAYMQDAGSRFAVMADRPAGVTATDNNAIEVMINRQSEKHDDRGANEGVFENKSIFVKHDLVYEQFESGKPSEVYREAQIEKENPDIVVSLTSGSPMTVFTLSDAAKSYAKSDINERKLVKFLFDSHDDKSFFVRIYNMDTYNPCTLNIKEEIFSRIGAKINNIEEVPLDFNGDFNTLRQTANEQNWHDYSEPWKRSNDKQDDYYFKSLEIRSFRIFA